MSCSLMVVRYTTGCGEPRAGRLKSALRALRPRLRGARRVSGFVATTAIPPRAGFATTIRTPLLSFVTGMIVEPDGINLVYWLSAQNRALAVTAVPTSPSWG